MPGTIMRRVRGETRKRREDQVAKRLPELATNTSHAAYYWMKRVKENILPPANTGVRKALDAIEVELVRHFGELNAPQMVQLNLLRPLLVWWMLHPGTVGTDGQLATDFKWVHSRIENGIRVLCELGEKQPARPVQTLQDYIRERYPDQAKEEAGHD